VSSATEIFLFAWEEVALAGFGTGAGCVGVSLFGGVSLGTGGLVFLAREGLVVREGLVAGEDLGPPSLRGMAGAELMGREGRSCHMRKEGIRVRTDVNSLFF